MLYFRDLGCGATNYALEFVPAVTGAVAGRRLPKRW